MTKAETSAKEFWGSAAAAAWWQGEDSRYESSGKNEESESFVEGMVVTLTPTSVLEVGAGTGRIIGKLGQEFPWIDAHSADISAGLCAVVNERHPGVITHHFSDKLPFIPDRFDMVFTYQVLQHVPPEDVHKLIDEMSRVSKQMLLIEGYVDGKTNGERTHPANGGSYFHDYEKLIPSSWLLEKGQLSGGKIRWFLFTTAEAQKI